MQKLSGFGEMRLGGIYNLVYVGPNAAYARINGKRTILVTALEPELQYVELFDQFGNPLKEDIRSETTTVGSPELGFAETEISEPADQSEWFKHALKVSSLEEALAHGVTREDIAWYQGRNGRIVPTIGERLLGVQVNFGVEDRLPNRPLLQSVYVVWKDWEAVYADFARYGVDVRP